MADLTSAPSRPCWNCDEPVPEDLWICPQCHQEQGLGVDGRELAAERHPANSRSGLSGTAGLPPSTEKQDKPTPKETAVVWAVLLGDVCIASLEAGDVVQLGRDYQPELCPYDNVHRYHALLSAGRDTVTIKDIGKANGVFVDGSRLAPNASITFSTGKSVRLASNCWLNIGRPDV